MENQQIAIRRLLNETNALFPYFWLNKTASIHHCLLTYVTSHCSFLIIFSSYSCSISVGAVNGVPHFSGIVHFSLFFFSLFFGLHSHNWSVFKFADSLLVQIFFWATLMNFSFELYFFNSRISIWCSHSPSSPLCIYHICMTSVFPLIFSVWWNIVIFS